MNTNDQDALPDYFVGSSRYPYPDLFGGTVQDILTDEIKDSVINSSCFGGMTPTPYWMSQHAMLASFMFESPIYRLAALSAVSAEALCGYVPGPLLRKLPVAAHRALEKAKSGVRQSIWKKYGIQISKKEEFGIMGRVNVALDAAYWELVIMKTTDIPFADTQYQYYVYCEDQVAFWQQKILNGQRSLTAIREHGMAYEEIMDLFEFRQMSREVTATRYHERSKFLQHDALANPMRNDVFDSIDAVDVEEFGRLLTGMPEQIVGGKSVQPDGLYKDQDGTFYLIRSGFRHDEGTFDLPCTDDPEVWATFTLKRNGRPIDDQGRFIDGKP